MNTAYEPEVKQLCSDAEVAYDPFHVVAKCGREVIDRIRGGRSQSTARRQAGSPGGQYVSLAAAAKPQERVARAAGETG